MGTQHDDISPTQRCLHTYSKRLIIVLFVFGCVLLIPSLFLMKIFYLILNKHLIIERGSQMEQVWQEPSKVVPITMAYNLFNYTNHVQILTGTKPKVQQIGPYVYQEQRKNHMLDANDDFITYEQNNTYVFDKSSSCSSCTENDTIVTPCIVSITMLNQLQEQFANAPGGTHFMINIALNLFKDIKIFRTLTIREVIWGYEDPVLEMLKSLVGMIKGMGFVLPPLPAQMNGPVALQKNGSAGMHETGNLTILTGKQNVKDTQKIVKWKGLDTSPYWLTKYGNMINGTDGSRVPPSTSRDDTLHLFVPQMCRSLYVKYSHDMTIKGLKSFAFSSTPDLFANHTANPDNLAFCTGTPEKPECWGTGLLPMSTCQEGAPIFMSSPHFWGANQEIIDAIDGIHPNETLHRTFMKIEPTTGIMLSGRKKLQINVMVLNEFANTTGNLKRKHNFLPIVYVEEGGDISSEMAELLKTQIIDMKKTLSTVRYVCMVLGLLTIACALVLLLNYLMKRKMIERADEPTVIYNEKVTVS